MFGKGFVYQGNRISPFQFLMLVVLRQGPMYGYEILRALRDEFKGTWRPETGALYPALKRLTEHGLVQVEEVEGKEYYRLAPEAGPWLGDVLRTIGPELIFASRYMEVLGKAALEEGGQTNDEAPIPLVLLHLVQDEGDPEESLRRARLAKEILGKRLDELDQEIERMEKVIISHR